MTTPKVLPWSLVPATSVPIKLSSMTLPPFWPTLIPRPVPSPIKRLMTSPRTVLPPARMVNPNACAPATLLPSNSIIGVPAKPGWVVPSMVTGSVMNGRNEPGVIVCTPPPPMLKLITSTPALALACSMAARSVQVPVPSLQMPSPVLLSPPSPVALTVTSVPMRLSWSRFPVARESSSVMADTLLPEMRLSLIVLLEMLLMTTPKVLPWSLVPATSVPIKLSSMTLPPFWPTLIPRPVPSLGQALPAPAVVLPTVLFGALLVMRTPSRLPRATLPVTSVPM